MGRGKDEIRMILTRAYHDQMFPSQVWSWFGHIFRRRHLVLSDEVKKSSCLLIVDYIPFLERGIGQIFLDILVCFYRQVCGSDMVLGGIEGRKCPLCAAMHMFCSFARYPRAFTVFKSGVAVVDEISDGLVWRIDGLVLFDVLV